MGLSDLVEEEKRKNNSSKTGLFGIKPENRKLRNQELCPGCGSDDTEEVSYYWRCNEDRENCNVTTYIPTEYSIDKEKWAKG